MYKVYIISLLLCFSTYSAELLTLANWKTLDKDLINLSYQTTTTDQKLTLDDFHHLKSKSHTRNTILAVQGQCPGPLILAYRNFLRSNENKYTLENCKQNYRVLKMKEIASVQDNGPSIAYLAVPMIVDGKDEKKIFSGQSFFYRYKRYSPCL